MKKAYIVGVLMIVVGVGYMITASSDVSTYASFSDAKGGATVKIAGQLVKNKPIVYNPEVNANLFTFYLEDKDGDVMKVKSNDSKPQDFELSEQVVITGKMKDKEFVASNILLKCPSKYKDQEVLLRENI